MAKKSGKVYVIGHRIRIQILSVLLSHMLS